MRRTSFFCATLVATGFAIAVGLIPGCGCNNNGIHHNDAGAGGSGGNGDMGAPAIGSITISPSDVTLDLVQGAPPSMQAFTVTFHSTTGDQDVSFQASYGLLDPTLGSMNGNTFSTSGLHGGTTTLTASFTPAGGTATTANAMIHVRVKGVFNGPDCGGSACPPFPGDSAPPCSAGNVTPQIYYPPDGVLLPPNMSVMSVHWTPFPAGPPAVPITEFEIAFKNSNTDVRVLSKCATQLMDTAQPTAQATGGCELVLDQAMWDFIAKSNRGGDAVAVSVRATTDGMCATPSTNTVKISFAEQDVNGGVYYWKSTVSANGTGGQIWAKAFGNATPEEQITGMGNLGQSCYGCHSLSRDGKYMTVNADDDDSDDEYTDVNSLLVDVKAKSSIGTTGLPPGFQAIAPDDSIYMGSDGNNVTPTNVMYLYDVATGTAHSPANLSVGMAGQRPTMPDWSADGKTVLFVMPSRVAAWTGTYGDALADDDHVFGGSIWSVSYDPMAKTFGMPSALLTSAGENNYYPGISPDGSFLVFNRVPQQTVTNPISGRPDCTGTGMQVTCPNDSFSNPKARIWLLSTKSGSMPIDAENANGSPAASAVDASNSWPRWSPFVQMYRGDKLLWVTFSSTRDYGLKVRNHKTGMYQCYPADSYEQAGATHGTKFDSTCQQPQIWMAAIDLSHLEFMQTDPSFAAFWLPFQDVTTHNHTAQWTQYVVDVPPPDMGMCVNPGGDCTVNPCCQGQCTPQGVCPIL